MRKPNDKTLKGPIYLTAYESSLENKNYRTVEVDINKHCELNPQRLRTVAKWMNDAADWLEDKDVSRKHYTLKEFKEIITDPMRVLFEALRYETDKDILKEIVSEIEEAITADMKADELTELNLFEYLRIINDPDCSFWREDFINEMIDRVQNPQPDNDLITARRLLYDYINLPDDDLDIVVRAMELIKNKKDKKMLAEYIEMYNDDKNPQLDGIGNIIQNLYAR